MKTKMVATVVLTVSHPDENRLTKKAMKLGIEEALTHYPYYVAKWAVIDKVRVRAVDFD